MTNEEYKHILTNTATQIKNCDDNCSLLMVIFQKKYLIIKNYEQNDNI